MCHTGFGNGAKNDCKVRTIQLILTLFIIIRVKAETEIPKYINRMRFDVQTKDEDRDEN